MKKIEITKEIEGFPLKKGQVCKVSDEAASSMIAKGNAKIYEEKPKRETKASK